MIDELRDAVEHRIECGGLQGEFIIIAAYSQPLRKIAVRNFERRDPDLVHAPVNDGNHPTDARDKHRNRKDKADAIDREHQPFEIIDDVGVCHEDQNRPVPHRFRKRPTTVEALDLLGIVDAGKADGRHGHLQQTCDLPPMFVDEHEAGVVCPGSVLLGKKAPDHRAALWGFLISDDLLRGIFQAYPDFAVNQMQGCRISDKADAEACNRKDEAACPCKAPQGETLWLTHLGGCCILNHGLSGSDHHVDQP
ncbi:MAG: hypothetical protein ACKOPR_01885 [Chakrabartia godavariana]